MVDLTGCLPTKETGHFPINKAHDLVILDYAIGHGEIIMHEAHVRVVVVLGEKDICFQGLDAAVGENVWIPNDVVASTDYTAVSRRDIAQRSKYVSCLLLEYSQLAVVYFPTCDVQTLAGDPFLDQHLAAIDLRKSE